MKNQIFRLGPCLFVLILSLFTACTGEPQANQASKQGDAEAVQEAAPVAAVKVDPKSIDEVTRAAEACKCFQDLYEIRQKAKEQYTKGDSTAFTSVDTEMREIRLAARKCAKDLVAPIREDAVKKEAFQNALAKACPNFSTSILLMTKLNFTPE